MFRGKRKGPVTRDALKQMIAQRIVSPETMVWHEAFGSTWRPLKDTELFGADPGQNGAAGISASLPPSPPPLTQKLNNGSAWTLALLPIFPVGLFVTELLPLTPEARTPAILFAYSACNFVIGFLDQRNIRRAGRTTPSLSAFYAWLLPPLYL